MFIEKSLLLMFFFSLCKSIETHSSACQYNATSYSIHSEWSLTDSCQTCKCLPNQIVICRNRTCQIPKECRAGHQLTIKAGACCPVCSSVQRSCLYDGTAILHNTIFYPKSCLQCRCRDGQLFCDNICRPETSNNKCSFHNELYEINSIWSPLPCVLCQCTEMSLNHSSVASICYIKECPPVRHCRSSLEFIPGQCCPVCRSDLCFDNSGQIYQNGDVWTRDNNCTHCICRNGSIICTEEICPTLQCKSNEKLVRLPNSCCSTCTHRSMCRFYGNQGYQIYYEHDIWYTSACQYCTCRRHNRILCKSIQCEYQFCLEHEIQESRSDSCCVSCRAAQQCHYHEHILQEGSYRHIDNCTLCTCTSQRQAQCYSNCYQKGYSIIQLKASNIQRNHTITITDSSATILSYSKTTMVLSTAPTRSLLFQFSSSTTTAATTRSSGAVLLGIRHNNTGQLSYRLILIDFDLLSRSTMNNSFVNRGLSDELRLVIPATPITTKSSSVLLTEKKVSDPLILIVLIIILSIICFVLILIILILCHQRKKQQQDPQPLDLTTTKKHSLTRPPSSTSIVEKFQAPDLTTKVTLLTHFHLSDYDFGTDV